MDTANRHICYGPASGSLSTAAQKPRLAANEHTNPQIASRVTLSSGYTRGTARTVTAQLGTQSHVQLEWRACAPICTDAFAATDRSALLFC